VTRIPLTQGLFALVDDSDAAIVNEYKWFAAKTQRTFYAARQKRIAPGRGGQRVVFMHNELMQCKGIDHEDGDGLNNQRSNLRPATAGQNARNRRKPMSGKSSRFKGVTKQGHKFHAQLEHNDKNHYLGTFTDELDAARAYDAKAIEVFGEFAATNEKLGLFHAPS
jgi:hypothetical protein